MLTENAVIDRPEQGTERTSSLVIEDITKRVSSFPDFDGHERILLGTDAVRGLTAIIAIHDTTLGPALGGTRIWMHENLDAAITDALRLSRGMTFKAAIAGLPLGGGKAVIRANAETDKTPALFDAYAEMLSRIADSYITAEDVGLTLADADYLRERTPNVAGTTIGGSGNPSRFTAEGVFLGMKAAQRYRNGVDRLEGCRVAVQGLGAVGFALAEMIAEEGAHLIVADLNAERCREATARFGAETVDADAIVAADTDILAPCALGGVISQETIPSLKAGIVAGSANNQLLRHGDAATLKARGVLYAPDYVINAGGLINVAAEALPGGYDAQQVEAKIREIPETLTSIFKSADRTGHATNEVALAMALDRIAAKR